MPYAPHATLFLQKIPFFEKKMRGQSTIADCLRLPILWEENTEINIELLLINVNTIGKVFQ